MGSIAKQATINTMLAYLGIGLGFLNVVLLYPQVLRSDEFGLTRLLLSVATVASQVAQLGMENTVIRYFPYFKDTERDHRGLLSWVLLFGTVVGLLAMLVIGAGHGVLSGIFSDENALYARYGLFLLPLILSEVYFILLRSYSRSLRRSVQPTFLREFILRSLQTLLIGYQAWRPMPFAMFLACYVSVFLLVTLLLVADLYRSGHFRLGWQQRWLPRRLRRSMVRYSGFTFSASLAGLVLGNMDQLMIGALLGKEALSSVAHYAVAFYFGSVIAVPARALMQAAVPHLAEAWKRRDNPAIAEMYRRSADAQLVASGLLFVLLVVASDTLFTFLPAEYADASSVPIIIAAAYMLYSATGLGVGIINMSRSYRLDAWSSYGMLVLNAVANFFLIRELGIVGAAWATLISLVTVGAWRTWFLERRYGLWPFTHRTMMLLLAMALMTALNEWLLPRCANHWELVLRVVVAVACYGGVVHVLGMGQDIKRTVLQAISSSAPGIRS